MTTVTDSNAQFQPESRAEWHIVTSEYPPQPGGVSDYTRLIAEALANAGDDVSVWCPSLTEAKDANEISFSTRVRIHRELGNFSMADLRRADRLLDGQHGPKRLLVQYVPHGYGYRAMNLPFCLWLWKRARVNGDNVQLMIHEPFLEFRNGWRQSGASAIQRLMMFVLLRAARLVWISIPMWESFCRPYAPNRIQFKWLPVPSTVRVKRDDEGVAGVRARYQSPGRLVVGHFGTYGFNISKFLLEIVPSILLHTEGALVVMLLGRGGEELRNQMLRTHPELDGKVLAIGELPSHELSLHLSACDLMIQPYPDGASSRRTSLMAALSHGLPVVTTRGHLTEGFWERCPGVALVAAGDNSSFVRQVNVLLHDEEQRRRLAAAALAFYRARFDLDGIVSILRQNSEMEHATTDSLLARVEA